MSKTIHRCLCAFNRRTELWGLWILWNI